MFVAVLPPPEALVDLAEFLGPRREAEPGFRWTVEDQWHITLAFMAQVADRHLDDLLARLERAAARRTAFDLTVLGGGAFPNAGRAKVLYAGLDAGAHREELTRLATGARAAGNKAGADADGGRFHPHLTLARIGRPVDWRSTRRTRPGGRRSQSARAVVRGRDRVGAVASRRGATPPAALRDRGGVPDAAETRAGVA